MTTTSDAADLAVTPVTTWWRVRSYANTIVPVSVLADTPATLRLRIRDRAPLGNTSRPPRDSTRLVNKHSETESYYATYAEARAARIERVQRDVALARARLRTLERVLADCESLPEAPTAAMLATPDEA